MYLLDTNVVSEFRKIQTGKAHPHVVSWADTAEAEDMFLSAISVQELELGILQLERRDSKQGAILRQWLDLKVIPTFAGRILPIDTAVARRSAQLSVPNPRPAHDGLIAATALVHNMTVVTRNVADFQSCGVSIVNPWNSI